MGFRAPRLRAGLRVADVQAALNVSDATVYMWETCVTRPRAALLPKIAKLYGCTVDELLRDEAQTTESGKTDRDGYREAVRNM